MTTTNTTAEMAIRLKAAGWRHYHPDRITKTDVYWIVRTGDDPTKAVLSEYGGAFDPISGIDFNPENNLIFSRN